MFSAMPLPMLIRKGIPVEESASLNLTPARSSRSSSRMSRPTAVRSAAIFSPASRRTELTDVGDGDYDLEWGDGGVEGVGVAAVGSGGGFDGGGEDALDADAVATRDGHDFRLAVAVEDGRRPWTWSICTASLKMWPISTARPRRRGWPPMGSSSAFYDVADVGDEGGLEVWRIGDFTLPEVELLFVGSGDEVGAAFEGFVEDDEGAGLFLGWGAASRPMGPRYPAGDLKVASISSATMGRSFGHRR